MQGFLDMEMKSWVRNLITRVIAIGPSLIVSIVSGPSGAGKLIIISLMVLSFQMRSSLTSSSATAARKLDSSRNSSIRW